MGKPLYYVKSARYREIHETMRAYLNVTLININILGIVSVNRVPVARLFSKSFLIAR